MLVKGLGFRDFGGDPRGPLTRCVAQGERGMRVAIIGAGISGNVCAWLLNGQHEVTLFEAGDYPGGHTHTIDVLAYGRRYTVDTGFMVFNDRTYPNFIRLLDRLGIDAQDSDMSFSVRCERTGFEFQGSSLDGLFAQRSNLLRPSFYHMLTDIVRFNRRQRDTNRYWTIARRWDSFSRGPATAIEW